MPQILLTGFRGSGKTAIGRRVAQRLQADFTDLDETILALCPTDARWRPTCSELFYSIGACAFIDLQRRAARRITDETVPEERNALVVAGAEALVDFQTQMILAPLGASIFIHRDFEEIWRDLALQGLPSHLRVRGGKQDWLQLLHEREPVCIRHARCVIDATGRDTEQTARLVLEAIEKDKKRGPSVRGSVIAAVASPQPTPCPAVSERLG